MFIYPILPCFKIMNRICSSLCKLLLIAWIARKILMNKLNDKKAAEVLSDIIYKGGKFKFWETLSPQRIYFLYVYFIQTKQK